MKPTLSFVEEQMLVSNLGESASVPDLFGETILQNQLLFRLEEDDELFEGYGQRKNAYPYRRYDGYTRDLHRQMVPTAVLENKYLKAVFLPSLGGRLWRLLDKQTGENLLYTNDVIRFSNLAVCNAWFSGGVEWNLGIIGHTPFTTAPLYTARLETDGGDPVLRMYEYECIRGVTYQMDFWLEEEIPFLNCRMRIANDTDETVPMYWWSNIAAPEYEGGRVVVPADEAYTLAKIEKQYCVCKTPVPGAHDMTNYKTIPHSCDHFFDIPDGKPRYVANLNREGYGLLQMSTSRLRGRKLFSWGNGEASNRWQEFLTENAGRYIEIQAGLGKTQYGCVPMAPHRVFEWMEQYGPVRLPADLMKDTHRTRHQALTGKLEGLNFFAPLEEKLRATKAMAKRRAELLSAGSSRGAFAEPGPCAAHLEFTVTGEDARRWQAFLQRGELWGPDPQDRPGEFACDEKSFRLLKEAVEGKGRDNWYAHYLLGVRWFEKGEHVRAEQAWSRSLELRENPWACHGLACAACLAENREDAIAFMERGLAQRKNDVSYLKEGFRLIHHCGGYETLIRLYDSLGPREQEISRLKFYRISAYHQLGQHKKAWELLEEKGGLELEDLREGEDSVGQLWQELHVALFGTEGTVPHRYQFKAG